VLLFIFIYIAPSASNETNTTEVKVQKREGLDKKSIAATMKFQKNNSEEKEDTTEKPEAKEDTNEKPEPKENDKEKTESF
jgi:hypothetical protein